jgi:hypothetical protein
MPQRIAVASLQQKKVKFPKIGHKVWIALRIHVNSSRWRTFRSLTMAINMTTPSSPALAALAKGSEFILTSELSRLIRLAEQTIRKHLSAKGHFFGIVPVKLGNRNLWRVRDVDALLGAA